MIPLGGFQRTTFELTAPLRLLLYRENRQLEQGSSGKKTDTQTDGHREGHTAFVGAFNVI